MASFSWGDLQQAADDAGFGVIPAGEYEAIVKSAEKKTTGTGKDKIAVRFSVTGGPSEGKSVFNDFVISPDNGTALGFFFRHMKALGLGPDYFATNPDLTKVAADLVGRNCVVVVGIRQWNEEDRNEIKGIKPSGSAASAAGPVAAGPQPTAQPQPAPTAQPQPTTRPQPAPSAQPQPAPTAAKKVEPPKKDEKAEPVTEATPAATPEPEDAAPAAEADSTSPAKPKLPF
jgi:Predicted membrane protein